MALLHSGTAQSRVGQFLPIKGVVPDFVRFERRLELARRSTKEVSGVPNCAL